MAIRDDIKTLADKYADKLKRNIDERVAEMENDDRSHSLIYQVLGVVEDEGKRIDVYQNKGRFLYNAAGALVETAVRLCFKTKHPHSGPIRIKVPKGKKSKNYGVDCLVEKDAIEIKWRDATTDGDHVEKEEQRLAAILGAGYKPVRLVFFQPNRGQAQKIQAKLKVLYQELGGEYYSSFDAWNYVKEQTGVDLLGILKDLAAERMGQHGK